MAQVQDGINQKKMFMTIPVDYFDRSSLKIKSISDFSVNYLYMYVLTYKYIYINMYICNNI
jgi:hypothetical protein